MEGVVIRGLRSRTFDLVFTMVGTIVSKWLGPIGRIRNSSDALARRELNLLASRLDKRLEIVYDNFCSPPTYGDFLQVVLLARYLSCSGLQITFRIVDDERRADWSALPADAQTNFVADQAMLARAILGGNVFSEVQTAWEPMSGPKDWSSEPALFAETVSRRQPIYLHSPRLLAEIFRSSALTDTAAPLLDSNMFPTRAGDAGSFGPYIAWHVRVGSWGSTYDTPNQSIRADYETLRHSFPHHHIVLIATPNATDRVRRLLGSDFEQIVPQPDLGFQGAIPWILGANFYFQRLGGGINQIAVFSSVPYLIIMNNPRNYYHRVARGRKLVPWAQPNQQYVRVSSSRQATSVRLSDFLEVHATGYT